jgi:hypothetical protein
MVYALLGLILIGFAATSCVRDRDFVITPPTDVTPDTLGGDSAAVLINEFVAKGSANANEFGTNEDWIELYNPGAKPLYIPDSMLFISDDFMGTPDLYPLPAHLIPAKGFWVIWADGLDQVATQVHTSFKLSSSGEFVGLSYGVPGNVWPIDSKQYGVQVEDAVSNGRSPDGSNNWIVFTTPTLGSRNQ